MELSKINVLYKTKNEIKQKMKSLDDLLFKIFSSILQTKKRLQQTTLW